MIEVAKSYVRGDRIYVRAQQIWMILSAHAEMKPGETITYGEVAERMGYDSRAGHTLGKHLGTIGHYCVENDLPLLNAIVVGKISGEPGDEVLLEEGKSVAKSQKAVHKFDWFSVRPPSTGKLRKVYETHYAPAD